MSLPSPDNFDEQAKRTDLSARARAFYAAKAAAVRDGSSIVPPRKRSRAAAPVTVPKRGRS
jgi:hypothetical protein